MQKTLESCLVIKNGIGEVVAVVLRVDRHCVFFAAKEMGMDEIGALFTSSVFKEIILKDGEGRI